MSEFAYEVDFRDYDEDGDHQNRVLEFTTEGHARAFFANMRSALSDAEQLFNGLLSEDKA